MEHNYNDDAFGNALMAYYKGETKTYIIERDDNYLECSELGVYFDTSNIKFGPDQEALSLLKSGMRVLDVGCGAGRHCLYLQERGVNVTGIDVSPMGLEVCKLRGVKDARLMAFEEVGKKFAGEEFDAVIMLGHNFGLVESFKKARKLLGDLAKITKPTGKIIATSRDPYATTKSVHISYHEFNKSRGRMQGQLSLRVRFGNLVGSWHDYLFVSEVELLSILEGTAWHIESTTHSLHSDSASYLMALSK
jgi:2-polyprenyl-3-methyl-5-hydroxy-6-metoxy-1,4-benzoquinol methylase